LTYDAELFLITLSYYISVNEASRILVKSNGVTPNPAAKYTSGKKNAIFEQ